MKKKNLNKAASVALAGLLLVNPMSAFAANGDGQGDGVAGGEGFTPGIEDDYFEVVLPTSATRDKMLDFKIDPYGRFASGSVKPDEQIVPAENAEWVQDKAGKWDVKKVAAEASDYKPGASIYFSRVDYRNIAMGRSATLPKNNAANFFGNVKNVVEEAYEDADGNEQTGKFVFSDKSNWIVATNKSSIPVSIKLEASWPQHEGIKIVQDRKDVKDGETTDPTIYMAVEMTEGYTRPIATDTGAATVGTLPVGENYMTVEGVTDPVLYLTDVANSGEQATQAGAAKWYNYMKTPNQEYKGANAGNMISLLPAEAMGVDNLTNQPYYLKQKTDTGKVYLENNIATYEKLTNADGKEVFTYPTYGFRLVGEANDTPKWENASNPEIRLMWRVEKGDTVTDTESVRPHFALNEKQDYTHDLDGVIDDRQFVDIVHGTGDYKTTKIEKVEWEMNGVWYNLLELGQPSAPDHDEVNELKYVTLEEVDKTTTRVRIREMALLNWHDHAYLKETTDSVTLRIWLDNYEDSLTLTIVDYNADK